MAVACSLFPVPSPASDLSTARRTAIVTAVEVVLPATVTIGAEHVAVQQVNPFRNLHDDFFSDWFSDPFFGSYRRAVRVKVLGSGILVGRRGFVLTNDHVVADAENIQVTLSDGRSFQAKVKGRGLPLDLALLEIVPPDKNSTIDLPYVTLGTSGDLALGEWAIAIGAPSNLEASVTAGVVSAVGRRLPAKQDYKYLGMIQTDASINPGNSGGPLVNADGKVVGINTVIISQSGGSEGLGFAIPADQARKVLADLVEAGEVRFAWFGWELSEDKSEEEGLLIKKVQPGSEVAAAGVQAGSRLVSINANPMRTVYDYEQTLLSIRVGQVVAARVSEDGKSRVVQLTARVIPESLLRVDLGLAVENVSPRLRRAIGGGVVVTDIEPDGYFGRMNSSPISPGDVILAIGNLQIDSVESYETAVKSLRKNQRVDVTVRRQNVLLRFTFQL